MRNLGNFLIKKYMIFIAALMCSCALFSFVVNATETDYSVKTVSKTFFVGSDIGFEFSGSKSASDWVGICRSEVASYKDDNFNIWLYLGSGHSGDVAPMTDVVESGKYSLKPALADGSNLPAGEYSLVMFSGDSYNEVARCNFKLIDLPLSSDIPKVEDITISDDNKNMRFALPDFCLAGDGYSVLLFWADAEYVTLSDTPFYSFDLTDNNSVEITFDNLNEMPSRAEAINVYLLQHGVISDVFSSVALNKTFVPLIIPDSEKSFSTTDNTAEKGEMIFNFLSDYSLWIIIAVVAIVIIIILILKFKKSKNKAEFSEF